MNAEPVATTVKGEGGARRLWLLLGLAALGLLVAAQLGLRWLEGTPSHELVAAEPCDLTQGCRAGGSAYAELRFDRTPVSHQPFGVSARLHGLAAAQVVLELQGVEMFMGLNRYPLSRQADGSWHGEIQLPVCSSGRMQWQARLLLGDDATPSSARYTFWTE